MSQGRLEQAFRQASARIIGALAAKFRDLDLAEDAFAEACARAAKAWPDGRAPDDAAAWLYRVAERSALDALRRRRTREAHAPDEPPAEATPEDEAMSDSRLIPDERLRLIFICCHPAVAPESRAALTLRLVCGLSVEEIARAFLVTPAALAQRLVRAKQKIAAAGVPFELPPPARWPERLEAVLSTLEVAYAKAHEDAAGQGAHAGFADEILRLTRLLARLAPASAEAHALAALVRFAEARRPARVDGEGVMAPLSEQDPRLWRQELIQAGAGFYSTAVNLDPEAPRTLQAVLQALWCARASLEDPPPWPQALAVYDRLLRVRDDPVVRLNRAVALAEVRGPGEALAAVERLDASRLESFAPYHAVRAELLSRLGRTEEARLAYAAVLDLGPPPAEARWLRRRMLALG